MPWIRQVSDEEATGRLRQLFDAARARAGRIWNIVRIMSPNPPVLESSMRLYGAVLNGWSPLTRVHREMLATVVSSEVGCHY